MLEWVEILRRGLERFFEYVVVFLLAALVVVVVLAVVYRKAGASLVWYDEVASIMLAWLTYYGAALAALKRAHIGFPGLVDALEPPLKLIVVALAEICVLTFFVLLAWMGWVVLLVLAGDTLVSLPLGFRPVHAVGHSDRCLSFCCRPTAQLARGLVGCRSELEVVWQ